MDIVVFVEKTERFIVENASLWCKENNITILKYKTIHSDNEFARPIIYGFKFYFNNKEDATAFKLRWG